MATKKKRWLARQERLRLKREFQQELRMFAEDTAAARTEFREEELWMLFAEDEECFDRPPVVAAQPQETSSERYAREYWGWVEDVEALSFPMSEGDLDCALMDAAQRVAMTNHMPR